MWFCSYNFTSLVSEPKPGVVVEIFAFEISSTITYQCAFKTPSSCFSRYSHNPRLQADLLRCFIVMVLFKAVLICSAFPWEGSCVYHLGITATTRRSIFSSWCLPRYFTLGLNSAGSECLELEVGMIRIKDWWRTVEGLSFLICYLLLSLASFIKWGLCCKSAFISLALGLFEQLWSQPSSAEILVPSGLDPKSNQDKSGQTLSGFGERLGKIMLCKSDGQDVLRLPQS